jgi:putative CocE/NonD family hydrolase
MKIKIITIIVLIFLLFPFALPGQIRQLFDIRTPMRDGIELSSDIWLPAKPGKYPALLLRTPYQKTEMQLKYPEYGKFFAENGYVFVVQDVRGRGDSEGEFNFYFQEGKDGYDAIEWIAQQKWCNGKVGTMGLSYMGGNQWLAAREHPPHLVCMASTAPGGNYFNCFVYHQGAWPMSWLLWLNITSEHIFQSNFSSVDIQKILMHRPLISMDSAFGREMRLWNEWLTHSTLDEYYEPLILTPDDYEKINLPVLHITGWFDVGLMGTVPFWEGMNQNSPAVDKQYLLIGPWDHFQTYLGGETQMGEMKFTEESKLDIKKIHLDFFNYYLKGYSEKFHFPIVKVYVTGINEWKEFSQFPPSEAKNTSFYLHSNGNANNINGDGSLNMQKPLKEENDMFTYDPKNPVMGNFGYARDCRETEKRPDMLIYTSDPLESPLIVIGEAFVNLYASSDAFDTDFTARLIDVYPDGKAINLGSEPVGGIIRARYRKGYKKEELLEPNKTELFKIELFDIGHTFLAGHRIRVEISSSAAPDYFPNQNTGNPVATDIEWNVAHQTIHHDKESPSYISLPILKSNN